MRTGLAGQRSDVRYQVSAATGEESSHSVTAQKNGQCARKWGHENVQKTRDFGGRFGWIRVKKGHFLAKKGGEKANLFAMEAKLTVAEGILGQNRTL